MKTEQYNILKSGVANWKKWLAENPGAAIDLTNANLTSANLTGADLTNANLTGADLTGAEYKGYNPYSENAS